MKLTRRGRLLAELAVAALLAGAFAFGLTDHHCWAPASGQYERCQP